MRDLVGHFSADPRILAWDLYNEPGNEGMGLDSLPLVEAVFAWARAAAPSQPLTVGVWHQGPAFAPLNEAQLALSDLISFHHYGDLPATEVLAAQFQALGRPVLCTEFMARTLGSRLATHLPMFRRRAIIPNCWGLVNGRPQTQFPWAFLRAQITSDEWFHDLFHPDGTPYREDEVALLRRMAAAEPA